jgi:hypothetical protein
MRMMDRSGGGYLREVEELEVNTLNHLDDFIVECITTGTVLILHAEFSDELPDSHVKEMIVIGKVLHEFISEVGPLERVVMLGNHVNTLLHEGCYPIIRLTQQVH